MRYVNPTFLQAFFPAMVLGDNFVDALGTAIAAGHGIRLQSMPLDEFVPHVKARRQSGPERYDFTVDLEDGSWWWINDRRLPSGWMLVVATEITGIKQEELRLREAHLSAVRAAETDFLTGLPNRRSGMHVAKEALENFIGSGDPLAIAVVDVDRFKVINDNHGHELGDEVLVHIARTLANELGPNDHVCRFGGEEFLVVMPATTATDGATRLRSVLDNLEPVAASIDKSPLRCTFSAGIAAAHVGDNLKELIARADEALYRAKACGRGRVEIRRPVLTAA